MPELSGVGLLAALLAGGVSFVSPCVLPLVPGYVSYVAGYAASAAELAVEDRRRKAIGMSLYFVLGFSTVFMILGASATALGQLLLSYRYELNFVGGAIIILFGLVMLGMAKIAVLQRDLRIHLDVPGGRPLSSYVLGLAFGFGWTPCIGPILGSILLYTSSQADLGKGMWLLLAYSSGLAVPFLLSAVAIERFSAFFQRMKRQMVWISRASGVLLIGIGALMVTNYFTILASYLNRLTPQFLLERL